MKITILGCGNAFTNLNGNQCFLLEETYEGRTQRMVIDCGYQFQSSLARHNVAIGSIDCIYISHLHADHIGGLEYVAFSRYDWATKPRPRTYSQFKNGTAPTLYCEENLMRDLWNHSLRGGLESMEGFVANLDTYFRTFPVQVNQPFHWQGWEMNMIQQIHIMSGAQISYAFGLMASKSGHHTVYFTTDSQFASPNQVEVFYEQADIIFQDCEISPFLSGVHANYIELSGRLLKTAKVLPDHIKEKMKLSHYQDFYNQGKKQVVYNSEHEFYRAPKGCREHVSFVDFDWDQCAKEDGFDEFVKPGNVYDTDRYAHIELTEDRYPNDPVDVQDITNKVTDLEARKAEKAEESEEEEDGELPDEYNVR